MNAIDITKTPRYKSAPRLQTSFITNADKSGDHLFIQMERAGNVALYKRVKVEDARVVGFELIKIGVIPKGTIFAKGALPTTEDTESYPGAASFGSKAWAFNNEKVAWDRFDKLVMGKA